MLWAGSKSIASSQRMVNCSPTKLRQRKTFFQAARTSTLPPALLAKRKEDASDLGWKRVSQLEGDRHVRRKSDSGCIVERSRNIVLGVFNVCIMKCFVFFGVGCHWLVDSLFLLSSAWVGCVAGCSSKSTTCLTKGCSQTTCTTVSGWYGRGWKTSSKFVQ